MRAITRPPGVYFWNHAEGAISWTPLDAASWRSRVWQLRAMPYTRRITITTITPTRLSLPIPPFRTTPAGKSAQSSGTMVYSLSKIFPGGEANRINVLQLLKLTLGSVGRTTTLNKPEPNTSSDPLADLPQLPRDNGGPVFAEPWEAQAFALAVRLSAQGHFTWKEWANALAGELKAAADRGEPDDGSHYYEHWLAALESLVTAKNLADPAALLERKEAWADAYRHTPHGKPVELAKS